jgi:hypothetical protein
MRSHVRLATQKADHLLFEDEEEELNTLVNVG